MNIELRKIRLEKNMSINTLSDLSGVHENTIMGFESGRLNTGYKNIECLAQALGVAVVYSKLQFEIRDIQTRTMIGG